MDCLVTQFKGVVDNDNLLKLGEARIPVVNGTITFQNKYDDVPSGQAVTINGLGDVLLNGESTIDLPYDAWTEVIVTGLDTDEVGYIQVTDKYAIRAINGRNSLYVEDFVNTFSGMDVTQFRYKELNCSLADIAAQFSSLTNLYIYGTKLTGKLSDFFVLKDNITNIEAELSYKNNGGKVTGVFEDLGHFYKTNNLQMVALNMLLAGTVEGFVAARLQEQPATAGSVTIKWLGSGGRITFQGEPIADKENNTIAWDAQGNITLS